jgi:dTDP-4-dehydrorhamnose reductase
MTESERPAVWITGAGGLIGSHLARLAAETRRDWRVVPLGRSDLDLADPRAVEERFTTEAPTLIIHCAALSRSPACQENPRLARTLNVDVPKQLGELCSLSRLVLFSTDLVFDGQTGNYTEDDPPNPILIYGETKAEAEALVLRNPRHLVVRTSVNAGRSPTGNRGFDEELRNAWAQGRTTRLFGDEYRTPIQAAETARAVLDLVRDDACGIYHVSGSEPLTRWEMGQLVAQHHPEWNPRLERTSLRDFPGPPRPANVTLNCSKTETLLTRPLPRYSNTVRGEL